MIKQQEKDKLQTEKELFLKNKSKQNEKFSKTKQEMMTKEINPHIARTKEDLDSRKKELNVKAVDSSQRNIFDKEHLIMELISLEKEFTKMKYEELNAERNTKKLFEQSTGINKEINSIVDQGKIVEVGRGAAGLWKFELIMDSNDIALMEWEIMRMRVDEN